MNTLDKSRYEIEATTLSVEVLNFLDVSARYLGKDNFPRSILQPDISIYGEFYQEALPMLVKIEEMGSTDTNSMPQNNHVANKPLKIWVQQTSNGSPRKAWNQPTEVETENNKKIPTQGITTIAH